MAVWAVPSTEDAPFDASHSWAFGDARGAGVALALIAGVGFVVAGIGVLGHFAWWVEPALVAGAADLLLMTLYFNAWLVAGLAISAAVFVAAARTLTPPEEALRMSYREFLAAAYSRMSSEPRQYLNEPRVGSVEYVDDGDGSPLLFSHPLFGGFDVGLRAGRAHAGPQFRLIAPSRFGYLGSTLPTGATPAIQAGRPTRWSCSGASRVMSFDCRSNRPRCPSSSGPRCTRATRILRRWSVPWAQAPSEQAHPGGVHHAGGLLHTRFGVVVAAHTEQRDLGVTDPRQLGKGLRRGLGVRRTVDAEQHAAGGASGPHDEEWGERAVGGDQPVCGAADVQVLEHAAPAWADDEQGGIVTGVEHDP
jgi:hypothetical protein